jgi:hypothetical protein
VLELEEALGISPKESIPHIPSFLLSRQQKSLKQARKKFQALAKRHEERCEALFYGLGFVEGSDAYRAPAWSGISEERESEDEIQSMQDTRSPPRKRSDIQVRKSGEQPLEEEEAFEAPEVVALAENKAWARRFLMYQFAWNSSKRSPPLCLVLRCPWSQQRFQFRGARLDD